MLKHIKQFLILLIHPTLELAVLTEIVYYFPRLCFIVCSSYSLGLNVPILDMGIHHNFPAETDKMLFCRTTFLSSLWLNKQSSEVADFHHCTILHHLRNSPDEKRRKGKTGIQSWAAWCTCGCHSVETFQLPFGSPFGQKGRLGCFSAPRCVSTSQLCLPLKTNLLSGRHHSVVLKRHLLFYIYIFAIQKGTLMEDSVRQLHDEHHEDNC